MLSKQEAKAVALVQARIEVSEIPTDDEIVIVDEVTVERSWGWNFFYTSTRWQETQDINFAIAGNAPLLVEKSTGKCHVAGTAFPIQRYIENFERTGSPHG